MNKIQLTFAGIASGAALLISVSLLRAKDTAPPLTISQCNTNVVNCVNKCQGTHDSYVRNLCEDQCLETWNKCMDKAGAPKANRVPPIKRHRIGAGRVGTSGVKTESTPTPTPRRGEALMESTTVKEPTRTLRMTPTPSPSP